MIKASKLDKELVVSLLASSFDTNQSVNYVIKQDSKRTKRVLALMSYSFDVCLKYGEIFFNDDKTATVCLLYPSTKKETPLLDVKLGFNAIGLSRVIKVLKRESEIKKHHPKKTPFTYLWFIGVDPKNQSKGIGSALLQDVIAYSKHPLYLETSVKRNLPWYKKYNFETYHTLDHGFPVYMMRHQ